MRLEGHSLIIHLNQRFPRRKDAPLMGVPFLIWEDISDLAHAITDGSPKAENLKATAIGEDWPVPGHEAMETSKALNSISARAQIEMIGVRQDDLDI